GRVPGSPRDRARDRHRQTGSEPRRTHDEDAPVEDHRREADPPARMVVMDLRLLRLGGTIGARAGLVRGDRAGRDAGRLYPAGSAGARRVAPARTIRRADARARSRHPAGDAARRHRRRRSRALGSRRAARRARAALPWIAVTPRPCLSRGDSRLEHRRRLPRAGVAAHRDASGVRGAPHRRVAAIGLRPRGRRRRRRPRAVRRLRARPRSVDARIDRRTGSGMKRTHVGMLLVIIPIALAVYWIAQNTYWDDVPLPMSPKGEAATNPFYAVQRFAEA